MTKIILDNNEITETKLFKIDNINDNFSFYYKDYLNSSKNNNLEINHKSVNEIFMICNTINEVDTKQFHLTEDKTSWDDVVTLLYENEAKTNHIPLVQTMTLFEDEVNTHSVCLS